MKLVHVSGFLNYANPAIQNIVSRANIIIFQRNIVSDEAFNAMRYWRGMGIPVLIDLDDAYHVLPPSNPAHMFWHRRDYGVALDLLERGLAESDGLVAPNRLLLYDWSHVCDGYYLQNFADEEFWPVDLPHRNEWKAAQGLQDRIIIGWGGSVSHYDGWFHSGLQEAAKRISDRHPEVLWMLCGNDHRIFEFLPVSNQSKMLQTGVPPQDWPSIVRRFDIGVAPLFGPYDQRRSWIKGLEYQLAGVPWIATRGEPYKDFADMGLGVHIDNGANSWEDHIENMIADLKDRQEAADGMTEMSRQWLAVNQTEHIKEVYSIAISKFTGVGARLPGVLHVNPDPGADQARTTPGSESTSEPLGESARAA